MAEGIQSKTRDLFTPHKSYPFSILYFMMQSLHASYSSELTCLINNRVYFVHYACFCSVSRTASTWPRGVKISTNAQTSCMFPPTRAGHGCPCICLWTWVIVTAFDPPKLFIINPLHWRIGTIKRKVNYVEGSVRTNSFSAPIFALFNGYFCWCKYLRFYPTVR